MLQGVATAPFSCYYSNVPKGDLMISATIYSDKAIKSPYNYVKATFDWEEAPTRVVTNGFNSVSFIVKDTPLTRQVCEESANITIN